MLSRPLQALRQDVPRLRPHVSLRHVKLLQLQAHGNKGPDLLGEVHVVEAAQAPVQGVAMGGHDDTVDHELRQGEEGRPFGLPRAPSRRFEAQKERAKWPQAHRPPWRASESTVADR